MISPGNSRPVPGGRPAAGAIGSPPAELARLIDLGHRLIADLLAENTGRLLDVGCGDGRLLARLAGPERCLIGIDPRSTSLGADAATTPAHLIAASAEALPFADAGCDHLVSSFTIEWLDPARFAAEARRVLRPGGRLVVVDFPFPDLARLEPAVRAAGFGGVVRRTTPASASLQALVAERP